MMPPVFEPDGDSEPPAMAWSKSSRELLWHEHSRVIVIDSAAMIDKSQEVATFILRAAVKEIWHVCHGARV